MSLHPPYAPTHFAGYELLRLAGSGGYFEVFQARNAEGIFALKRIKRHLMYDRSVIASLQKEADMLARLDSPRFPRFFKTGEAEEFHFIVLEFIEGRTLEALIQRANELASPLPWPRVLDLMEQLSLGLEELHQVEIEPGRRAVHGDFKPRNSMLSAAGEVKIIDLGLQGGTFNYMPLERLHTKSITPFSDVYALGQSAYELLHGERLYKSETTLEAYFEIRETKIDPAKFRQDLPTEIREILRRCLDQETEDRFKEMSELRRELEKLRSEVTKNTTQEELSQWLKSFTNS